MRPTGHGTLVGAQPAEGLAVPRVDAASSEVRVVSTMKLRNHLDTMVVTYLDNVIVMVLGS